MLVQASILFLCVALVSLAVAIAFPWWQSYGAAYPVVLSIAGGCFMAAPATFILGFAGFGATAAALGEDAEALQLCLASRDPP